MKLKTFSRHAGILKEATPTDRIRSSRVFFLTGLIKQYRKAIKESEQRIQIALENAMYYQGLVADLRAEMVTDKVEIDAAARGLAAANRDVTAARAELAEWKKYLAGLEKELVIAQKEAAESLGEAYVPPSPEQKAMEKKLRNLEKAMQDLQDSMKLTEQGIALCQKNIKFYTGYIADLKADVPVDKKELADAQGMLVSFTKSEKEYKGDYAEYKADFNRFLAQVDDLKRKLGLR